MKSSGLAIDRPEHNTARYNEVYAMLRDGVRSAADGLRVPGEEVRRTPYPPICRDLEAHLGTHLTPYMIEDLWHAEAAQLLAMSSESDQALPVNPDRLGQMISRLLSICMRDEDQVLLHMPESHRCGYLGAGLRHGYLTLQGDVGQYAGAHIAGNAIMAVQGKSGDYAGFAADGHSHLTLTDDTGRFAGMGAGGHSVITIKKRVRNPVGLKLRGRAKIIVEQENLEVKSPSYDLAQEPAPSLQAEEAGPVQLLAFEDAAGYLGLTPLQLEHYTRLIGHHAQDPLSPEQLLRLRRRWPELGT